jgi:hypothetical protein
VTAGGRPSRAVKSHRSKAPTPASPDPDRDDRRHASLHSPWEDPTACQSPPPPGAHTGRTAGRHPDPIQPANRPTGLHLRLTDDRIALLASLCHLTDDARRANRAYIVKGIRGGQADGAPFVEALPIPFFFAPQCCGRWRPGRLVLRWAGRQGAACLGNGDWTRGGCPRIAGMPVQGRRRRRKMPMEHCRPALPRDRHLQRISRLADNQRRPLLRQRGVGRDVKTTAVQAVDTRLVSQRKGR